MHVKHDAKMRFSPLAFLKIGCVDVASTESDSVKFLIPSFMCTVAVCFVAEGLFSGLFPAFLKRTRYGCLSRADAYQKVQAERCDCAGLVSRSAG